MRYKDTEKTIPEIAKELKVAYILDGSIRKYGDDMRLVVQLVEAETDENIWMGNYDRTLTDIFAIQTEVSKEIADALELNLSFEEQQGLEMIPTENLEAYKLFLTGRKEADKRNSESLAKSIELYEEAIALDPNYAEAYAEIANSVYLETYYSGRDHIEASKTANEYLDKAERINDKLSRVYSVRGLIYNIEGKHQEADEAFKKAIALSPNDLTARHQYSTYFYYTQQYEKQLEQAEIAYKLDPLSFATANSYFTALTANFKYEEAEQVMKNVEKLSDGNNQFVINRSYFRLYIDMGDYERTIAPLKKMVSEQPVFNRFLAYCYGKVGDTANVMKTIDTIRMWPDVDERNFMLGIAYAGIKQKDSVLFYLDTLRTKQSNMVRREYKDFLKFLADDPEFNALLKSHGIQP